MKKKIVIICIAFIAIIVLILGSIILVNNINKHENEITTNETANLTLLDKVDKDKNTYWCGTMQLCWNDLIDNVAKQNIKFDPQLDVINNLNQKSFSKENISDDDVYTFAGKATIDNKKIIEKEIYKRFNEKSDLLNQVDWSNDKKDICYSMLKKEFLFNTKFNELEKDNFKNTANVNYFGFETDAKEKMREQVDILFYKNDDNFAIKLKTSTNDEIIFYKNPEGSTFDEMYKKLKNKSNVYNSDSTPKEEDSLKIPNIALNQITEFYDIENKKFEYSDGSVHYIEKAIQTINFSLDKTGGKIKSEAIIQTDTLSLDPIFSQPKKLYINDNFVMFLIEKDKDVPYFAMYVNDIAPLQ